MSEGLTPTPTLKNRCVATNTKDLDIMAPKKVLIIGPGYIGWNVLELLARENYAVTGFVRRREHGEQIRASGASEVVCGELGDAALLAALAAAHDAVIHTAGADHLASVEAVLAGARRRADAGLASVFIHTSGTAMTADGAAGAFRSDRVHDDDGPAAVDALPDDAPHRPVDRRIVAEARRIGPRARVAIMIPPTVYGVNPRHDGRLSMQIPTLVRHAARHGYAGHVGAGLSVHSNVHVLDLARAYVALLHELESSGPDGGEDGGDGGGGGDGNWNPYCFCEATGDDEPSWRDIAAAIGRALHAAGVVADPTPRTIPPGPEYDDLEGPNTEAGLGMNSRTRAVRLRRLGWAPVEKGWEASLVEDELPLILGQRA
ncbi:putative alpha beta hydrolase fold-1 protein [Rosellinia necatrix]|uniref:Putative alpha beta hydrolase fold-1 protein n=1 Tax=Rosellinia necatrix TaxID=77044 RepID=A0A1S7UJP3_ROSNE|nr:putative alpha beta hydrolase fold-1 protein [Rosellinia necatrix]